MNAPAHSPSAVHPDDTVHGAAILDALVAARVEFVAALPDITTVEGLSKSGELHPLQHAFLKHFSFQCGYSAPGFLMAAYCMLDRLKRSPIPKSAVDAAIEDAVGQHICRCTGYVRYHRAIREVILDTAGLAI